MKILQIVPSYKPAYVYGGTIESVARLCEALTNGGTEVMVYTTTANGREDLDVVPGKEQVVDGVKVIYFKRIFKDPFYISPSLWKQLYRDCRKYDVVHIHSWWNMIVIMAAFICKIKGVKMIFSPRGMLSDYIQGNSKENLKRFIQLTVGRFLLKGTTFHATSYSEYNECRKLIPGWKGFIIPNILWLPPLTISKPANDRFTIIFLSRIHPKKGIEMLMEAVSHLATPCVLKIGGTGDENYIQKLKKYVADLNITEKVQWLGWQNRDEKFLTLMQADLFALTSYNENFGNVVVEALNAGTPVLISAETGVCDFVQEYDLGWICKPEMSSVLITLQQAITDREKRKHITSIAPALANNCFSEKKLL